jgi:outer membrane lipoprotein-sorting protein
MRHALPALSLLVLASSCVSTSSSNVDDIIASNLAARGGKERIQSVNSIRQSGTATASGGRVAQIVREIKRPGLFRLEFTYQGTTSVFANDGTNGWQIAPLQGTFAPLAMPPESDAAGGADQRDIEGPLVDWKQKGNVVTLVDHETIDGKDTFKLKTDLRGGGVRYDYIDSASRQIIRSDVTRLIQGHATVLQNTFSDFRATDGLVFPRQIEMRVKDRPQVVTIAVDKIEINPSLDEARFRMPR